MMCRSRLGSVATLARSLVRCGIRLLLRVGGRRVGAEQRAGFCDVVSAVGVGEEPVVADCRSA
jgi:hypothetical protein